jgi:general secretion pathway protein D
MKKITFILLTALLGGISFAQEASESVESILKELGDYQGSEAPTAAAPAAALPESTVDAVADRVAEEPVSATPATEDVVVESASAEATADMDKVDVDALVEESRDLYAGGEFVAVQAGFEKVVKVAPENIIARLYLRKLYERDARKVEVNGMKAVDGSWNNGLVLRSYPIAPDAAKKMGLAEVETATDVEGKFPEVDFPKGASAVYQPKLETLFVRNTRDNLTVLEEIIEAMDVAKLSSDVEQVEIEAKFVEVSEGTLEELGFDWSTSGNIDFGDGVSFDSNHDGSSPGLFSESMRTQSDLPYGAKPSDLGAGSIAASGNWSAFRFENAFSDDPAQMEFTDTGDTFDSPVNLMISALDQSSGADVLSAPRIVTQSGEEAVIRVGELHTYPETYEPSASGGNMVHVKYDDFEETLLGVELSVTPQVDGGQITMELKPKITELQGWQSYEVAPENSSYTWYQYRLGLQFNHDEITASLPIFRVREIKTEVTIADGATIGMGGLVNEKVESFEDKVPVLGSIPVVGRLFRNEGERAVKRNLLMFVTAKKVEPTGRINTARSFE